MQYIPFVYTIHSTLCLQESSTFCVSLKFPYNHCYRAEVPEYTSQSSMQAFCTLGLTGKHPCMFLYLLSRAVLYHSRTVVTTVLETIWPVKPKLFTSWTFTERLPNPASCGSQSAIPELISPVSLLELKKNFF